MTMTTMTTRLEENQIQIDECVQGVGSVSFWHVQIRSQQTLMISVIPHLSYVRLSHHNMVRTLKLKAYYVCYVLSRTHGIYTKWDGI